MQVFFYKNAGCLRKLLTISEIIFIILKYGNNRKQNSCEHYKNS